MRAMFLEFLEDRTTHHLDQQFMLGPSVLVAPSFVPDTEDAEYYLPYGRWTSYFDTSRTVDGPVWVKEKVGLDDIPLWIRQDTVLALGPEKMGKPDYEFNKNLDIRLYELGDKSSISVNIPNGSGTQISGTITVTRIDNEITLSVSGQASIASVALFMKNNLLEGCMDGKIVPSSGTKRLSIKIREY